MSRKMSELNDRPQQAESTEPTATEVVPRYSELRNCRIMFRLSLLARANSSRLPKHGLTQYYRKTLSRQVIFCISTWHSLFASGCFLSLSGKTSIFRSIKRSKQWTSSHRKHE
jgi:hypothetical protein